MGGGGDGGDRCGRPGIMGTLSNKAAPQAHTFAIMRKTSRSSVTMFLRTDTEREAKYAIAKGSMATLFNYIM